MNNSIKYIINIILIVVCIYFDFAILKIFLPISTISYTEHKNISYYKDYSLNFKAKKREIKKKITIKIKKKPREHIKFKLIALYSDYKNSVATVKGTRKVVILSTGEKYNGFEFKYARGDTAYFEKNKESYQLVLNVAYKDKKNNYNKTSNRRRKKKTNNSYSDNEEEKAYTIEKKFVNQYIVHQEQIWREININKTSKGYKIYNIKRSSIFSKIGLQNGDIIQEANGKKILNNRDAMLIYQNINKIDYLELKVLRNGQEINLEFNIR
jgi:type II secretory pathway component PulC